MTTQPFFQYRINQAAKALGVSRKTIMAEIAAGRIKTINLIQDDPDSEQRITQMELQRYVTEKSQVIEVNTQKVLDKIFSERNKAA